jgi:hypothetical protein
MAGAAALAVLVGVTGPQASAQPSQHGRSVARAGTSATIGQTTPGPGHINCGGPLTGVQQAVAAGTAYSTPTAGVVTSFSTNAGPGAGNIRALFFTPGAPAGHWNLVAKSAVLPVTVSTFNTFPVRISVPAGATLGIWISSSNMDCGFLTGAGDEAPLSNTFNPEADTDFSPNLGITAGRLNISAVVESDADGDGFGDVTQDACPASALTQAACPAPDTKIKQAPPKSSTNRNVLVKFKSTIKKSSFKCSLDGGKYRNCSSPYRKTLAVGKHVLKVQAISPVGIADPTPAKVKFRILKR